MARTATDMDREVAHQVFDWWLRHPVSTGVEDALLALRGDATELPMDLRGLLGPLPLRTYDAAARLLLWVCHAPNGPRCSSYRAALDLLRPDVCDPATVV